MRYIAVASPAFMALAMPAGLNEANFAKLPFIVFNRKDDMQAQWVARAMGVRDPRLKERYVPSSEAGARAAVMGWGVAVIPELLARPHLDAGALVAIRPEVPIDVALYWHQWKLGTGIEMPTDGPAPVARSGLMEQIGQSLIAGARSALLQP
jgi:LysR family transcriptional regulator (chromosome initiation inhibitor)